ncbi:ABC-ATPase domain-containing protein [Pseudobacteriovorax antillogorgiicola]|uniref:Predicted ATPase of the ABC class n=1 Tax=Pseudobacteriovorax antillogorgiicola TaxID=1513793 RepID=A0A1Y6CJ49_9BACT|nr:ABC-ATPase domain-containing protein [Pseudobacteriovorax antillogorgiicola]TCS46640.1 putative ABC-class ATPase [Pseudobacteriovorax antillogorgiicola]SMF66229.1 Predicted ATPase of the ABC class [Pseudobacteriovorax antillogorgiicola]
MDHKKLEQMLIGLHHKNYRLYKEIKGETLFPNFRLIVDHVQGDPFAAPSKMRIFLDPSTHQIPQSYANNQTRTIALRDYITRKFSQAARKSSKPIGTGKGGFIGIDTPGQQILDRSSCFVHQDHGLEIRFTLGLPADGRKILGREAAYLLINILPQLVEKICFPQLEEGELKLHVDTYEDNAALRKQLSEHHLVAFVANNSRLPRASGIDDRPLASEDLVPFATPSSFEITLSCPHRGSVKGMGIPQGVTLIVGGGYHGKSTLLHGIEKGIYAHIPGDGREFVVTEPSAFKVRSEDGRSIQSVAISPFINNLPQKKSTRQFSSLNASGSTSQAANIMEALELDCQTLLIDEDTSATNFMIRDHRMQALIVDKDEPITPFIDRIQELKAKGISTIMVVGGSGDYFEVADHIIGLKSYEAMDMTQEAKTIAEKFPSQRHQDAKQAFQIQGTRCLRAQGLSPRFRNREQHVKIREIDEIFYGSEAIDLSHVEQLVDGSQLRTIAYLMAYLYRSSPGSISFKDSIIQAISKLGQEGYEGIHDLPDGDMAQVRPLDLACALNRLRSLSVDLVP